MSQTVTSNRGRSKWGLRLVREPSFAWVEGGGSGRLFCGLVPQMCLERCGGYRPASALSASLTYSKVEGGGDDEPGGDDH